MERVPSKLGIPTLWAMRDEEKTPDVRCNTSLPGRISEYPNVPGLGKLSTLVCKVVRHREVVNLRPGFSSADLGSWKDDGMEDDIVFSDKLIQLDIIEVAPPLLPLTSVACGDGDISNAGTEPWIDDLLLATRQRDFCSPSHVPRDAARL